MVVFLESIIIRESLLQLFHYISGIESVNVPIKIIVTENEDIQTNITVATNSQTEVKTEQLESLSAFQKKLELYYTAERNNPQLFYERRSQQYNSNTGIKRTQVVSMPMQIKAFASIFLNSPHLVSGYYGTLFNRFKDKIFNEGHKCSPYYVSALTYYRIEQLFRSGELDSKYKKARFHIMLLVRLLIVGEPLAPFNSNKIEKKCEKYKNALIDEEEAIYFFKEAVKIFDSSTLDKSKRQYKSEAETQQLIDAYRNYSSPVD